MLLGWIMRVTGLYLEFLADPVYTCCLQYYGANIKFHIYLLLLSRWINRPELVFSPNS